MTCIQQRDHAGIPGPVVGDNIPRSSFSLCVQCMQQQARDLRPWFDFFGGIRKSNASPLALGGRACMRTRVAVGKHDLSHDGQR